MEQALAVTTVRFGATTEASALDALSAHVALIDAHGIILTVNEAWRRYSSASGLQLPKYGVGQPYLKILDIWAERHEIQSQRAALAAGIEHALVRKPQEFEIEYPCYSPVQKHWFRILVTPINDPHARGALVMHFDITARKASELGLRKQQERHLLLLNSTNEGIYALGESGICTFANLAAAELLGYEKPSEMIGMAIHQLHHYSRSDGMPHPFNQYKIDQGFERGDASHADDEVFSRRDGTRFAVEYWARPIRCESRTVGTVVTFLDISERQLRETQFLHSQKMETVGRLAGGIAHDFSNTLAIISGYGQLVEERMGTDELGRNYARQIGLAAKRATKFTRQLLGLNHRRHCEPVLLNLNTVITSMEEMLRRMIGENVVLTVILQTQLRSVTADLGQIEQVLMNLIVNARDAMPNGGELVIRTSNGDGTTQPWELPFNAAGYLWLIVSDNGSGMDQATQARIFEPFFTTKEIGKGTGLGLSTVRSIARESKGDVLVQSTLGFGSSFTVFLPFVANVPGPALRSETPRRTSRGSETILVIEDDEALRAMISDTLRTNGYTVLECQSGERGIELATNYDKSIDILLCDVMLPDINGGRVAEAVLRSRPSIEVVYMSGCMDEYIAGLGIIHPESTFLEKPFDLDLMFLVVRRALDGNPANSLKSGKKA